MGRPWKLRGDGDGSGVLADEKDKGSFGRRRRREGMNRENEAG